MPHKSNFIRMLHRFNDITASLFLALRESLKELNCSSEYVIDSFPGAVCRNVRIKRCQLLSCSFTTKPFTIPPFFRPLLFIHH